MTIDLTNWCNWTRTNCATIDSRHRGRHCGRPPRVEHALDDDVYCVDDEVNIWWWPTNWPTTNWPDHFLSAPAMQIVADAAVVCESTHWRWCCPSLYYLGRRPAAMLFVFQSFFMRRCCAEQKYWARFFVVLYLKIIYLVRARKKNEYVFLFSKCIIMVVVDHVCDWNRDIMKASKKRTKWNGFLAHIFLWVGGFFFIIMRAVRFCCCI